MTAAKVTPIRKAAPRRPRKPSAAPAPDLVAAVDAAVAQMHWLQPSDRALVEIARKYAAVIETIDDPAEMAKRAGWIGPHLVNALKALGGAPSERLALGVEHEVKGRLAELRAARDRSTG